MASPRHMASLSDSLLPLWVAAPYCCLWKVSRYEWHSLSCSPIQVPTNSVEQCCHLMAPSFPCSALKSSTHHIPTANFQQNSHFHHLLFPSLPLRSVSIHKTQCQSSDCSSDNRNVLPVLVLTWLPSDPPHPPTMSGWSFCYSNLMSPRPCLKHIDGSFLIAKWVPTPYQGTQDALITHLSTHRSLHSLFHILLACTKLFPSFVPLQIPEMLFSPLIIWWCPFISPFQLNHICSTKAS